MTIDPKMPLHRHCGMLLSRSTNLKAPDGFRTVLVFGLITVPETSQFGYNTLSDVLNIADYQRSDYNRLIIQRATKQMPHVAAWNIQDTLEEVFGITGGRDQAAIGIVDRALELLSHGAANTDEFRSLIPHIKEISETLPHLDSMRSVIGAIVKTAAEKEI